MTASWHIGKIRGIAIGFHWSMTLVFVLLTISLATAFFPETHPDLGDTAYWIMAIFAAIFFFGSILLHELGHAFVAQRNGMPVNSITLFIFGGIAQIGGRAPSAPIEFRIAAAGPAVSIALAGILGLIAWIAQDVAYIAAPLGWLASLNLILALFNLLPGFPLDGGRILRALIWQFTGSEQRAINVAVVSGQLLAFGLMGLGAYMIFTGPVSSGLWMILIGWFLQNAAMSEATGSRVELALRGGTVAQAMGPREPVVSSRMKLRQLLDELALPSGHRYFLVIDEDMPRGVVTLRDVAKAPQDRLEWISVSEVMTPWSRMTVVTPETDLQDALSAMDDAQVSHLPVMEGDRVRGLLTREEVLHYIRVRLEAAGQGRPV